MVVPVRVAPMLDVDEEPGDDDEHDVDDDDIVTLLLLLLLLVVAVLVRLLPLLEMLNRWASITLRGVKRYDDAMSDDSIADPVRGLRATTALELPLEDGRQGPDEEDMPASGADGRCRWKSHSEAARCGGMSNAADRLAAVVA